MLCADHILSIVSLTDKKIKWGTMKTTPRNTVEGQIIENAQEKY